MKTNPEVQANTTADLALRCARPDAFQNFDRVVRTSLSVPKEGVLKEEARVKKQRARQRAKKS